MIIVGIDEGDVHQFPEPMTLWHRHIGDFLRAASDGQATAVGLDIALPERSFNQIVPDYDQALMSGILAARKSMPTVLALTLDAQGNVREIERKFRLVAGEEGTGLALFPRDVDGVVRRFDERLADNGANVPTLVGQLARGVGLKPESGIIDFSVGEDFNYLPLRTVLAWSRANDKASLTRHFEGRPVILGSVLPSLDSVPQPINLASWEAKADSPPGVLLHAQALRSLLNGGLVRPVPAWSVLVLLFAGALWWFAGLKPILAMGVLSLWAGMAFAADLWLFRQGWHLPLSGMLASALCALAGRSGVDAALKLRERRLLQRAFSARSIKGAAPRKHGVALSRSHEAIRINPVQVAQGAIVMRRMPNPGQKLKLLSLSDTTTLELRPLFQWQPPQPELHYQIGLLDDTGKPLLDTTTDSSSVQLPESVKLQPGVGYTWVVSAKDATGKSYSNAGDFSLASSELRAQVKRLRPAADAPVSERVVFATWLEQVHLRDEARKYWKGIAADRQGDARLKVLAGE